MQALCGDAIAFLEGHYVLCKHLFAVPFLAIVLAPIFATATALGLLVLWLYQRLVEAYLRLKLGSKFVCLITGCNLAALNHGSSPDAVANVYFIKTEKPGEILLEEIRAHFQKKINEDQNYGKLLTFRKISLGYLYYTKAENIHVADYIRATKGSVEQVLNDAYNAQLPCNGEFNWELILAGPLLLIRYHHSLADAISAYNIFSNLFFEENPLKDAFAERLKASLNSKSAPHFDRNLPFFVKHKDERTTFYRETHDGNSTAFLCETDQGYMKKIRTICKAQSVTLFGVILTCYSDALTNEIQNNPSKAKVPISVSCACPRQMDYPRLVRLYSNRFCSEFGNDFTGYTTQIPLRMRDRSLVERLKLTEDYLQKALASYSLKFNYRIGLKVLDVLPMPLIKLLKRNVEFNSGVSIVPGGPRLHLFNGAPVENHVFLVSHMDHLSLGFSIVTYDDKLQLGLIGGKGEDVDGVLSGVFAALDQLHREVEIQISRLK